MRRDRVARRATTVPAASEGRRCFGALRTRLRRPARDGWHMSAHLAALHPESGARRRPHVGDVPPRLLIQDDMIAPPLGCRTWPVMKSDASETRYSTALAM